MAKKQTEQTRQNDQTEQTDQTDLSGMMIALPEIRNVREDGSSPWRNRIVGYGFATPGELMANPLNWRIHPQFQQDALTGVLDDVGWIDNVTVNVETGFVVDGHARVLIADRNGETRVPIMYVRLTPEEEAKVLISKDSIGSLAATDAQKQTDLLDRVKTGNAGLTALLDRMRQDAVILMELQGNNFTPNPSTEVLAGKDGEKGITPEEKAVIFNDSNIKQIVLFYDTEAFNALMPKLARLRDAFGVSNNSDLFTKMVEDYETD
jgi:hypothetical protein